MMTESQLLFTKTIDIIPLMSQCLIDWYTSDYTQNIINQIGGKTSTDGSTFVFIITEEARLILKKASVENEIELDIFHMEISHNGIKLLQAYDAFKTVIISPLLKLPDDYVKEFVDTQLCFIANIDS